MAAEKVIDEKFLSKFEAIALYVRTNMQGYFGGNHRTRFYGSTVEFADYREYVLGDDIRRIDWNLYSRFEKYFIKLFVDERQMHMQIFLDCSASMQRADKDKALYAMRVAAALGFLSVQSMDRTSIRLIKGDFAEDLCGTIVGKNSYYRGIAKLEEVEFKGSSDLEKAIINCPNPGANNGLTVIISDFMTDSNWKKAVDYLLYQKRQVTLIQVLSPEEIDPLLGGRVHLMDYESESVDDERNFKMNITRSHFKAYKQALDDFIGDIKSFCAARGVDFFSASCDEPVEKLLLDRMFKAGTVR